MKKVRTIIWDLDDTVWLYQKNEVDVLCKYLNIDLKEKFSQEYYKMWEDLFYYFKDRIVTYDGVKEFMASKIPTLKLVNVSIDDFLQTLCDKKSEFVKGNKEAIEMIKYFYERGFHNISITDWFVNHQKKALIELNVLCYIEKIYGCDNSYLKNSDAKIYEIEKQLEMYGNKEEFVIIGDSLSSDISFAKRLGIKSIWYNPNKKQNNTSNIPTLEVNSLLELKNIF